MGQAAEKEYLGFDSRLDTEESEKEENAIS